MGRNKHNRAIKKPSKSQQGYRIIVNFEITDEPIENPDFPLLPKHVEDDLDRLYNLLIEHPKQVIPELLEWKRQFPNYPKLNNYIGAAYARSGQHEKTIELIKENYSRFPRYLFARVNYAELCIQDKKYDQVPAIFEHKQSLKDLYPERSSFHVSEITSFYGIMGIYYYFVNKTMEAETHYEFLKSVNAEHEFTRKLGQYLAAPVLIDAFIRSLQDSR
ncbi:MAG: hypothetical protein HGA45_22960 [Chloroflexales bacterium]|nr:hypothetical protein [Chloroflexales bacterium]